MRIPRIKKRWLLLGVVLLLALFAWRVLGRAPHIEAGSALVMTLEGEYVEGVTHPLLVTLGLSDNSLMREVARLRRAARDARIETVVLRVKDLQLGWGRAAELRQALAALEAAGKRRVALLETEGGGNAAYYVASAADEVYVTPAQQLPFVGLAGEAWYLGGLFEKLGVQVEYERIGRYKNAAERYAHAGPSEASRRMNRALFDSLDETFVSEVAASRELTPEALRAHIDAGPTTPEELQRAGLIDGESGFDELLEKLGEPPQVTAERYDEVRLADLGVEPEARFALVYGVGPVVLGADDAGGDAVLAADAVIENLQRAAADDEIDALVFRINSPGGSPLASDLVWRALRKIEKPVVVSMSDLAASGGYYVASAADYIVSQPATLTGSIGVFALRPSFAGLYEKLGISVERQTRGARADLWLSDAPLSAPARELLTRQVKSIYELFLERVVAGRPEKFATRDAVHALAEGRVWTGAQALENGLVDGLGGLPEALAAARELAGLSEDAEVELIEYGSPAPGLAQLFNWLSVRAGARAATRIHPAALPPTPVLRMARTLLLFPPGAPLLLPEPWVEFR